MVLIAQSAADDRLYAVERVQEGIYALCRLELWVTTGLLKGLQAEATSCSLGQRARIKERPRSPTDKWWRGAAIEPEPRVPYHESSAQKASRVRLCLQKPVHNTCPPMPLIGEKQSNKPPGEAGSSLGGMMEDTTQEPEEMLAMIRSQYQDFLYASKVSFCYYTISHIATNFIQRPHWHTLPRDLYPELAPLFHLRIALAATIFTL